MSKVKIVLHRLYNVLMVLLIIIAVIAAIGIMAGIRPRIIITSSMEPEILKGSLVLLNTSTKFESLEEGDVVAFRSGNTEVMHRITDISEDEVTVTADKGTGKATVSKSTYIGKFVISFPLIGGALRNILERGIWIVVLVAVAFIVIGCIEKNDSYDRRAE